MNEYPLKNKVIILNAPPLAGKDVAANLIAKITGCSHLEFKATLHNIAMAITGLPRDKYFEIYNDREKKETPQPEFLGMSPRDMLIWISEDVCKPEFGKGFFGYPAANSVDLEKGAVFSDGGFPEEIVPLCDKVGSYNVYIVRFTREGATFEGDSRNYLQPEDLPHGVNICTMANDTTLEDFVEGVLTWVNIHHER